MRRINFDVFDLTASAPRHAQLRLRQTDGVTDDFAPENEFATGQMAGIIVCTVTITTLFFLRCLVKWTSGTKMQLDDWTCILAWVAIMIYAATAFAMLHYGLGHHVEHLSPASIQQVMKWLYASSVVYIPATYLTKVTILLLFARVFSVMARVVKGLHIFIIALTVAYLPIQLLKTFSCTPIPSYWDPSIPGTCLDLRKIFVSDMALAVLTDATILFLPIPLTWSLTFSWRKKLKIGLLLGAGGAAVAVTAYRMYRVIEFIDSQDPTYDFALITVLTLLEMSVGLSCACLPNVNALFERTKRRMTGGQRLRQHHLPRTKPLTPSEIRKRQRRRSGEPSSSKMWSTVTEKTLHRWTSKGADMHGRHGHDTPVSRAQRPSTVSGITRTASIATTTTKRQSGAGLWRQGITSLKSVHLLPYTSHSRDKSTTPGHSDAQKHNDNNGNIADDDRESQVDNHGRSSTVAPESPDFDIEMQMSSGRPVTMTRNHEQVPTQPESLRLVDSAQGRREGWLAPAEIATAAAAHEQAVGRSWRTSAMGFNVDRCRLLRDGGEMLTEPDRIWDGSLRQPPPTVAGCVQGGDLGTKTI